MSLAAFLPSANSNRLMGHLFWIRLKERGNYAIGKRMFTSAKLFSHLTDFINEKISDVSHLPSDLDVGLRKGR